LRAGGARWRSRRCVAWSLGGPSSIRRMGTWRARSMPPPPSWPRRDDDDDSVDDGAGAGAIPGGAVRGARWRGAAVRQRLLRHLRLAPGGPRPAAARGALAGRRVGERLLPTGLSVLGSDLPPRATDAVGAAGDARPDESRGDGSGHARASPGRAGGGVRVSGWLLREARLERAESRAGLPRSRPCGGDDPRLR